jgi:threonine/homoserine/homoserine lactone efflux protein
MAAHLYLTYLAACVLILIVPGPTVTLIIANSLRHGARAALLNVAGTQLGMAVMIGIVFAGLASLIHALGWWFDWVRLAGAAYLVWLGVKFLRSSGSLAFASPSDAANGGEGEMSALKPRVGFFLQGFLVLMSNPKALLLFGALFPQFIDRSGNYVAQVRLMGVTAMAAGLVTDSTYAILSGRTAALLNRRRVRLLSRTSGLCLIGGGVWLALTRSR